MKKATKKKTKKKANPSVRVNQDINLVRDSLSDIEELLFTAKEIGDVRAKRAICGAAAIQLETSMRALNLIKEG